MYVIGRYLCWLVFIVRVWEVKYYVSQHCNGTLLMVCGIYTKVVCVCVCVGCMYVCVCMGMCVYYRSCTYVYMTTHIRIHTIILLQ